MNYGGIILCGGKGIRMGCEKALLSFGDEPMLARVIARVAGALAPVGGTAPLQPAGASLPSSADDPPVMVVAAAAQELPPLPPFVQLVRDRRPDRGPLEALAAGLTALPANVDAAFVTGCDVPLLMPAFIRRMFELLGDAEVAVPRIDGHLHPLAAVYRRSVLPTIEEMLARDQLKLQSLFDLVPTRFVSADELRPVDPQLHSLWNVNTPDDLCAALAAASDDPRKNR